MTKVEELLCREGNQNGTTTTPTLNLRSLTTETTGELDILRLNGDTLGVDGAKVGIFEEGDKVSLDGLLKSTDGR